MTKRLDAISQAACLALLVLLVLFAPAVVVSQEQKTPESPQPGKNGETVQQKQGDTVSIPGGKQAEPAAEKKEQQATSVSPAEPSAPAPEEATESAYEIKQGDTLWDIANTFLKDPFLWPFIWKANPGITNPDLIFAGNKLTIPNLGPIERAMQAPAEKPAPEEQAVEQPAPKEEAAAPVKEQKPEEGTAEQPAPAPPAKAAEEVAPSKESALVIPEEQPLPIIDKYSMLSAGFVNSYESVGMIVGAADHGKTMYSYDDIVYVHVGSKENVSVGDKYLIYEPLQIVKHPKTGQRYGRLVRGLGILQITAKDSSDVLTARITLSFDDIGRKSLLTPYQEPSLIYPGSERRAKDISGYILEVSDGHTINAQTDIVYLDKGSLDGVDPGDRFMVYAEPEKKGFPKKAVGEVQVFLVKDRTSTAVVSKSSEELNKGEVIDYRK